MNEDLSTAQRLQMAAMFTDALSNLIDRSQHLCHTSNNPPTPAMVEHCVLLRQTVQLTAATCAETIQALLSSSKADATSFEDVLAKMSAQESAAKGIGELP